MKPPADIASGVINLDQPGTYPHWSIFSVSVANLVLIAVMVVIFGLALILPFPRGHTYPPAAEPADPAAHRGYEGVNSLHLWSVELFMALLVIHLWGKFWMAAWRGKRALTWITGMVAFLLSVVECFTGYLSQQNFDSQWISTSGKDAFNAVGIGAIWNAMNFGQMLMWHIVLVPIALTAIIVLALVFGLAAVLSSPNVPELSVQTWARVAPADFLATASTELNGTSETASYGPPYNTNGTPQKILFAPANILGVTQPINTARDFVLTPLNSAAVGNPGLAAALASRSSRPRPMDRSRSCWPTN